MTLDIGKQNLEGQGWIKASKVIFVVSYSFEVQNVSEDSKWKLLHARQ